MKKISTIFVLFLSFTLFLSGCNNEPAPEENDIETKVVYASRMDFDSTVGPCERIVHFYPSGDYIDCIFVKSEEESHGYGDDVIVAWPTENTELILYNLNDYILDESVDLSPYSLANPITFTDVIEKWEDVNNLLGSFSMSAQAFIVDPSNASGFEASEDEESTES